MTHPGPMQPGPGQPSPTQPQPRRLRHGNSGLQLLLHRVPHPVLQIGPGGPTRGVMIGGQKSQFVGGGGTGSSVSPGSGAVLDG